MDACTKASGVDEQDMNSHKCQGKTRLSNKIGKNGATLVSLPYAWHLMEVREKLLTPSESVHTETRGNMVST